ncbi:MAG: plasmid pRiA4b ORF-3 family protein [Muribaculaceae bacterium]|nr:plasmid pRiA4b ORF-3 family protein [Muribaculaceae bacterium]
MKLKLTPQEIFEAYEALNDADKMEFMMKLMGHFHDTMGFPLPEGMEDNNSDKWGENPLDPDEDLLPTMGLTSVVCHPERPSRRLTVRVELKGIKPPIWRKLVIPSNLMLESFAHIILISMGWEMEHLHQFVKDRTFYSVPIGDEAEFDLFSLTEKKDSRNCTIGDLIIKKGDKCTFEYDFGDGWEHLITVQESRDYDEGENRTLVTLTGGKRACPPEDIGGVPGYMDFCEIIKNPKSKRAQELIEWYGDFDPEEFDHVMFGYDIEDLDGNGEEMMYE